MTRPAVAGYSGTPLAKKLGIAPGSSLLAIGAPVEYASLLRPVPEGVRFVTRLSRAVNVVHVFTVRRADLGGCLRRCRAALAPEAVVWISWPKRSSGVASEVTEDTVRELALPLGYVDIKVCAVSEVWSGLKLVVRKELR